MSNVFSIRTSRDWHGIAGFLNAAARMFHVLRDGISDARRMHDDYLKLSAMTDPELEDMGIRRSDISSIVAGTYPPPRRQRTGSLTISPEHRSPFRQSI